MKLIFIRHGDPDYLHDSLTLRGQGEAKALNARLRGWGALPGITCYTSPLGRAQETARRALAGTGLAAEPLPWLEEFRGRLADGEICWDLPPSAFAADAALFDAAGWPQAPTYRGTNVAAVHAETVRGLDALLAGFGYTRAGRMYRTGPDTRTEAVAVCFCHMAITLDCLSHLLNMAAPVLWQQTFLPPASLTVLGTEEQEPGVAQWRMQAMADVAHLKAAGLEPSRSGYFAPLFLG